MQNITSSTEHTFYVIGSESLNLDFRKLQRLLRAIMYIGKDEDAWALHVFVAEIFVLFIGHNTGSHWVQE